MTGVSEQMQASDEIASVTITTTEREAQLNDAELEAMGRIRKLHACLEATLGAAGVGLDDLAQLRAAIDDLVFARDPPP